MPPVREESLKATQEWEGTGIANHLERSNGAYHTQVSVNGVRRRARLDTTQKQVAIARLRDRREEAESSRVPVTCTRREEVRMLSGGACKRLSWERVDADRELGASSRSNYRDGCKRVCADLDWMQRVVALWPKSHRLALPDRIGWSLLQERPIDSSKLTFDGTLFQFRSHPLAFLPARWTKGTPNKSASEWDQQHTRAQDHGRRNPHGTSS